MRAALGAAHPRECTVCEGLPDRIEGWADLCVRAAAGYEFDTFLVGSVTFDEVRVRETELFEDLAAGDGAALLALFPARPNSPPWPAGEWLKSEINREVGRLVEARAGKKVDFGRPHVTFRLDTRFDQVELQVADVFVKGRYRKFVRDLPQTRWPCRACGGIGCRQCGGSGKTYETSVEELVAAPFLAASGAEAEAFHGMGREDIDARTLGRGRPFILELKRPRRRVLAWQELELEVNRTTGGRVEVEGIGPAGPDEAARYKAADPAKTYHAVCDAATPVDRGVLEQALGRLVGASLEQRTPQRVAHRRADLVRRRTIQALRILAFDASRFTIEIRADSGTYIKEFVSGDEGRTRPNLAQEVGAPLRVVELDVVEVDWPEAPAPEA